MAATLSRVVHVRSQRVLGLLEYLGATGEELARNPLLDRFGRKLDGLRVPPRVMPYEPIPDIEEVRERARLREGRAEADSDDGPKKCVYAFRGTRQEDEEAMRSKPEAFDDLESRRDSQDLTILTCSRGLLPEI